MVRLIFTKAAAVGVALFALAGVAVGAVALAGLAFVGRVVYLALAD